MLKHTKRKDNERSIIVMETIIIKTKKYNAVIEYESDKNITLKDGAKLGVESPSLDKVLKATRKTFSKTTDSGDIITVADITFHSKSACASFIVGSPQSGNRFFEKYLSTTTKGSETTSSETKEETTEKPLDEKQQKQQLAESIITFCKDFGFDSSLKGGRALNTMQYVDNVNDYILGYMELTNYPQDLVDKAQKAMQYAEWKSLMKTLKSLPKRHVINQRLSIKYGAAGTGKTTDAIAENPTAVKIVASASADPDDLFTRFEPSKKDYVLTELGKAMVEGKPIIIDECNLYNQVVLTRLQGCLDNTKVLVDRGIEITIADGFKVIMTMNLETNLGKTPLPQPLVDRAYRIENYSNRQDLSWVW